MSRRRRNLPPASPPCAHHSRRMAIARLLLRLPCPLDRTEVDSLRHVTGSPAIATAFDLAAGVRCRRARPVAFSVAPSTTIAVASARLLHPAPPRPRFVAPALTRAASAFATTAACPYASGGRGALSRSPVLIAERMGPSGC